MIDLKSLQNEVQQTRQARLEAEAASCELEELIWQIRHLEPGRHGLLLLADGYEPEPRAPSSEPVRTAVYA
jgi:hypothetical protein